MFSPSGRGREAVQKAHENWPQDIIGSETYPNVFGLSTGISNFPFHCNLKSQKKSFCPEMKAAPI